jgi:dihydrofolate synthase/folylpolyglutamate synthase
VYLDGAHNPAEAEVLAEALQTSVAPDVEAIHLVCGMLRDKDRASMVRALAPVARTVVVTQPPLEHRQGDLSEVAALFEGALGAERVSVEPEPMRALDAALGRAGPSDAVVVAGSMFLTGALRERWVPEENILRRRSAAVG